jgi:hypothetical protein
MHGSTGGSWTRNELTMDVKKNDTTGNRQSLWLRGLPSDTSPPSQLPTLPRGLMIGRS